jgi:chromosome segregation ATPase
MIRTFVAFVLCVVSLSLSLASAGELEDARKDLAVVRATLDAERQRYNAAKAEMDRSIMFARTEMSALLQREKELAEKIEKLEKKKNEPPAD